MNKHTASFNGQTFTRSSKTRRYSHVVVGRLSLDEAINRVDRILTSKEVEGSWKYLSSLKSTLDWRGNVDPERAAKTAEFCRNFPTLDSYRKAQHLEAALRLKTDVADGEYATYYAIGWAGRQDLAEKVASQNRSNSYWADVRIVKVELK